MVPLEWALSTTFLSLLPYLANDFAVANLEELLGVAGIPGPAMDSRTMEWAPASGAILQLAPFKVRGREAGSIAWNFEQ